MIRTLLHKVLDRVERRLGTRADEGRYMLNTSPGLFLAFGTVQTWADRHTALPPAAYSVAKIAAYRQEDCGSCLQIAVNLALRSGVDRDVIRHAIFGHTDALAPELQDVYHFAEQQANRIDNDDLREKIRCRYGDRALIELGLAIASARMFPALKRALGFAKTCSRMTVEA